MTLNRDTRLRNRVTGDRAAVRETGRHLVQLRYVTGPLRGRAFTLSPGYVFELFNLAPVGRG